MRIIKFRGWHTKLQRMFSAAEMARDQLTLLPTGEFINVHGGDTAISTIYPMDKFIPLQYTGLKDRRGIEIYEGDIVEVFNIIDDSEGLWEVHWATDRWHLRRGTKSYDNGDYYHGYEIGWDTSFTKEHIGGEKGGVIVQGNIYQHPYLLQTEKK